MVGTITIIRTVGVSRRWIDLQDCFSFARAQMGDIRVFLRLLPDLLTR